MRPGRASAIRTRCLGGVVGFALAGPAPALSTAPLVVVPVADRVAGADSVASAAAAAGADTAGVVPHSSGARRVAAPDSTALDTNPGIAAAAVPESVTASALDAQLERLERAGRGLAGPDRRVLTELLAAARQMADDGDLEAALLLVSDASSFLDDKAR